jgi:hypothetical protein
VFADETAPVNPRNTFWSALLAYGLFSIASVADSFRLSDTSAVVSAAAGALIVASAAYALRRPEDVGGPEKWDLTVVAAVLGAVGYALALLIDGI